MYFRQGYCGEELFTVARRGRIQESTETTYQQPSRAQAADRAPGRWCWGAVSSSGHRQEQRNRCVGKMTLVNS